MKSPFLRCASLFLLAGGCASETRAGCPVDEVPGRAESVEIGLLSDISKPDDLVAWEDGDVVPLERGGQGSLMLVAGLVVRGEGFDDRNGVPMELTLSVEGTDIMATSDGGEYWVAGDGSWYSVESYMAFWGAEPEDGDVLSLRVRFACFDIQRTLVADRPVLQPEASGLAATDLDRGSGKHDL